MLCVQESSTDECVCCKYCVQSEFSLLLSFKHSQEYLATIWFSKNFKYFFSEVRVQPQCKKLV